MKPTIFAVSCLLIALATNIWLASAATNRVIDVDGKDLLARTNYYILPVVRGNGGGLKLGNARQAECPSDVVQEPNEVNRGLKATFVPQKSSEEYIRESTDVNIQFSGKPTCKQSTNVWRLDQAFLANETTYISTGGSIGNPGASTFNCWYKIVKVESGTNRYKLRFCPSVCKYCTPDCGDIGILIEKSGTRRLVLNTTGKAFGAFEVFFKKA
ncbi:Kunitz trypsin inhibitor [Heracleum sosnowskyi]|uniref:Kunitz trypsin inhibitor n=1 Tax=Heracleum sosnowskyi TaxID=360622 RepID=A0AAD8IHQ5_9APIA|nr:Kunitz trypsin inhibitor [Heracleum sosnowskyi]